MECPECGKESDSRFCPDCGASMAGEATGQAPAPPPMPPPPSGVKPAKKPPKPPPPPPGRADLAGQPPEPPPLAPGATVPGAAPEGPETAATGPLPPQPPTATRPKTSGWAVASLVMGILGFTCLFGLGSILAIVFGFIGRSDIRKSQGAKGGKGLATTGIVLGILMIVLAVAFAAVVIPLSYLEVGPTRTMTRTVETGAASAVDAVFEINNGNLDISGGTGALMNGRFTYNISDWRPVVRYSVTGTNGQLTVRQPSIDWWRFWQWIRGQNNWDVRLGGGAPINLRTNQSFGKGNLYLRGVNLSALDSSSSAGDLTVVLPGTMQSLKEVNLSQSAGKVTLTMYGDYPALETLDVSNSAGAIDVGLIGKFSRDLSGTIKNSAGSIKIRLPRDVGVYVNARTSAGRVSTVGMDARSGNVYVNNEYGKSPVTLRLTVTNSAGNIELMVE
jgi:hypothetical protein